MTKGLRDYVTMGLCDWGTGRIIDYGILGLTMDGTHVGLQDDGGGDSIDQFLVLAFRLAQSGVNHGLVSHHRGETLIIAHNFHVGQ